MSRVVVYQLKVWQTLAEGDTPYYEFETDNELHLIREIIRVVSDHPFMARFTVTKGES